MRLRAGQLAPQFTIDDIYGRRVSLAQYRGRNVLLTFNRAAVCPLCNVRTWHLIHRYPDYQRQGLEIIAFFESAPARAHQYLDRLQAPYPIVADLQHRVYALYGLESSLWRALRARLTRWSVYREAARKHIGGNDFYNVMHMDGAMGRLPADFIIGPAGEVRVAYYGHDAGDFLLFADLDRFTRTQ
jgi:thioredoxin-dependent peroxiredoxin